MIYDRWYDQNIYFNPVKEKPPKEVIFTWKIKNITYPNFYFNNLPNVRTVSQKHLGLVLGVKLTFKNNTNEKLVRQWLLKDRVFYLPRVSLLTIYKSFVRPHLDYENVIYYQHSNASFSSELNLFNIMLN